MDEKILLISSSSDIDMKDGGSDSANARLRRIQLRSKRSRTEVHDDESHDNDDSSFEPSSNRHWISNIGIKKQARYVPEEPLNMTKDELSNWRKEARRVRNRESAAASRQKTRQRIEELEGDISVLHTKYTAALQYILQKEDNIVNDSLIPDFILHDLSNTKKKTSSRVIFDLPRPSTPNTSTPMLYPSIFNSTNTVSPPITPIPSKVISPTLPLSQDLLLPPVNNGPHEDWITRRLNSVETDKGVQPKDNMIQHYSFLQSPTKIVEGTMISRPTAVCVVEIQP